MAISRGMVSKQLVSGKKYRKGSSVSRVNEAGNYTKPTIKQHVKQPRSIAKKTARFRKV